MFSRFFRHIKVIYLGFISLLIGMRVTLKNFFAPSVTLDYPRKKQPMTANFRGMVDLKPEACVICYQCIKICPTAALYLSHKQIAAQEKKKMEITKFTYNAELCCFCGLCDEICPTDAIFMNKMYEVSAYEHEQILSIDLMSVSKYTHLDTNYSLAAEVKRNEENTVGKVNKPAPVSAPASGTVTAAAGSSAPAPNAPAPNAPAPSVSAPGISAPNVLAPSAPTSAPASGSTDTPAPPTPTTEDKQT